MVPFYKFKKESKTHHLSNNNIINHLTHSHSHTNVPIVYNSYVKYNKIQYNKGHTIYFRN
jgi:hypothetical protein